MAFDDCADVVKQALGRALSKEEAAVLNDVMAEVQKRARKAERTASAGASAEEAILKAADDYAQDMAAAAVIEKRNAALNLKKRLEVADYVKSRFADNPALGLEAVMVGVNRAEAGARFSAAAQQRELKGHYIGGALADLEKAGVRELLASGDLDRDVARALYALDNPNVAPFKGPKQAQQIAEILHKWQEVARVDANLAGAWVKKMPGYIARQGHDVYKIRSAGYEAWRDAILPKLDLDKTLADGGRVDEFLEAVYDGLASGVHLKTTGGTPGFKGPRNVAKGLSHERVLHFKSADDWMDYNDQFGTGNLREAFFRGIEHSAQSTGLMRALGPNPGSTVDQVVATLKNQTEGDPARRKAIDDFGRGKAQSMLAELDGSINIPGNAFAARVSANLRAVQNMAKLGGAVVSSVTDIPVYASEMRYQGGGGYLTGMVDAIGGLLRGRPKGERAEILSSLGVFFDSAVGDIASRFSAADDLGGRMSKAQRLFFRLNGLAWWTETLRSSAALSMSHRLAGHADTAWGGLNTDLRRTLGLYGIDEGKWDLGRAGKQKLADGNQYFVPEAVRELPDERFAAYLEGKGVKPSPAKIRDLKIEVESQFRSYFSERASIAVLEPDVRTKAFMRQGYQPGTFGGELARFIGQFKSFSVGFTQSVLGREIYGRGSNTLGEALRNGHGEMTGLAQLILWTTAFGYGAMVAKDMLKGRTPRPPDDPKTWAAAMTQGGGLGIFGDFLFGEANRFGGGLISTAAGPVLGAAEDLHELYGRALRGDDLASAALRTAVGNTPFANLFYTRAAMDYLILYSIQENLNPGSLRRMERRVERENGQTFLAPPSQNAVRF